MTDSLTELEPTPQLKLISWNIERSSIERLGKQLTALQERVPDIIALQEVGLKANQKARQLLREHGFEYAAHSHDFRVSTEMDSSGIAFASRWPFRVLSPETFSMPFQHQALSAEFFTPFGRVEGHTVHVLPGSMYGESKVEMFEGIYEELAIEDPPDYRFLCGDFNSPKAESEDGEVTVWGSDDRKIAAERSVIIGLAEYDLTDAYRAVNGYGDGSYSFVTKNQGSEWRRRFDHVFASERLNATEATYLHEYDDLSDHTPLEVVFAPDGGLEIESTEALDRSPFTQLAASESDNATDTVPSFDGLRYEDDARTVDPDDNYRRGRFKVGWNNAVDGTVRDDVLDELTWQNLGWRFGKLLGDTPDQLKEELYEWCVDQQIESE